MAPAKRPWLRFYVEAIWDRKLRRQRPEHRWLYVVILACARSSPDPGRLLLAEGDPMLLEDLVDAAGMPEKNVKSGMVALTKAGLVVRNDDTWVVPTWKKRQFESDDTASRTAKHRSKERSNDDDVTHQITETDTEAELVNSSPPPTSSVADSVVAVNGLQDLLVGEGFEPGDVAIVMRKLDNRQRFGERVKDPVEWSRPQIEKLAKARIAASRNGNGAHPKRVEVDGETFELVEGQWQAVAS